MSTAVACKGSFDADTCKTLKFDFGHTLVFQCSRLCNGSQMGRAFDVKYVLLKMIFIFAGKNPNQDRKAKDIVYSSHRPQSPETSHKRSNLNIELPLRAFEEATHEAWAPQSTQRAFHLIQSQHICKPIWDHLDFDQLRPTTTTTTTEHIIRSIQPIPSWTKPKRNATRLPALKTKGDLDASNATSNNGENTKSKEKNSEVMMCGHERLWSMWWAI